MNYNPMLMMLSQLMRPMPYQPPTGAQPLPQPKGGGLDNDFRIPSGGIQQQPLGGGFEVGPTQPMTNAQAPQLRAAAPQQLPTAGVPPVVQPPQQRAQAPAPQPQAQPQVPVSGASQPPMGGPQNTFVMDLLSNLLRGGGMGGFMGGGAPLGGGGYMGMQPSGFGGYMGGGMQNPMMGSPWGGQSPMMVPQQNPMFSYLMDLFQQSRPPAGGFAQNQPQAPPIQPQVPQAPVTPRGPAERRRNTWENRAGGI